MIPEKLEECPICQESGPDWLYDGQVCLICGYPNDKMKCKAFQLANYHSFRHRPFEADDIIELANEYLKQRNELLQSKAENDELKREINELLNNHEI